MGNNQFVGARLRVRQALANHLRVSLLFDQIIISKHIF
jgi:hypothetical protein